MKRTFFAVLLLAAAAHAQPLDWKAAIADADAALQKKQYADALEISERTIADMKARLGTEQTQLFATVVAQKAAALAGLGHDEEARWYASFAEFLGVTPAVAPSPLKADTRGEGDVIELPVPLRRTYPVYPEGARQLRVMGVVIIECLIDRNGVVREGRVRKSLPVPTLAYAAIEAVRKWQFQSAMKNGQPANVVYNLIVNFQLGETKR